MALCCSSCAPGAKHAAQTKTEALDEGPSIKLDTVYVEERRDGRIVWSARAPEARGSAQQANVTELSLHVNENDEGAGGLFLEATRAELMLDSGHIVLHDLNGHDERGMTFETEQARFSRHTQALVCDAPIELRAPMGSLSAAGAHLLWALGEVDFDGPVTGRLLPVARASASP